MSKPTIEYIQQRPLFSRTSRSGKDVGFTSGQQPKVADFDWELFDLYPENDSDLKKAAAALPRNVFLSDFWIHQKYDHNMQNRYANHKADFTKANDPRLDRVACGRAAKVYDKGLKMFCFAVDAKYQLHGEEGRSQGLRTRSDVDDGPGEQCDSQADVVPDSKVVLPPAKKSDPWWMGLTRAEAAGAKSEKIKASQAGKNVAPQDDDDDDEDDITGLQPLQMKKEEPAARGERDSEVWNQLNRADRKFTDAAILINGLDVGHLSNRDGLQSLVHALEELEKHKAVNQNLREETYDLTERIQHCHRLQDQIDDLHIALDDARAELQQQKAMDHDTGDHDEAVPSPNSVVRSMNTTAPRALGTTKPTIMPSASAAFFIILNDTKLINLSSDFLPNEILHGLRTSLTQWNSRLKSKPAFTWTTIQSNSVGRSCIETRVEKKKSQWADGAAYVCTSCEQRRRLCLVVDSAERVLLLPRKAAENEGRGPKETICWRR